MKFLRKQTRFRSWSAMIAAYAVVLHAFFGGIVVSQNAAAAGSPFVICHGSGDAGDADQNKGQPPAKHIACALLCASHAAGTVPQALPEIVAQFVPNAALPFPAIAGFTRASERTPRLAQAPPSIV
jgi:hypothetical protein